MTEITKHTPGSFCWTDLATTDPAAARKFYTELLGITARSGGSEMPYTLLQRNNKDVAGIGELMKEQRDMGVPPHWLSYVCVENADETAKQVQPLGGKVLMNAFDVMNHGRMAVLEDPTGGVFAVWQPKEHIGTHYYGENGTMCWNELMTTNTDVAGRFYTQLFNWKTEIWPGQTPYTLFKVGDKMVGGMMGIAPEMGPMPSHWSVYFAVDDCDAKTKLAEKLGGKVCVPPTDIPDVGRFAVLADPQGGTFSILKPLQQG
jgi:uncharacterized protein